MKLAYLAIAAIFVGVRVALYATSSQIEVTKTFTSTRFAAPAWKVLTDFESIPKWNSRVLEARLLSKEPARAGTQFTELRKGLFSASTMTFTVEQIGNNRLVVAGKDGSTRVDFDYTLDEGPAGSSIRLHFVESPTPLLLSMVLTPLYSRVIDGNVEQLRALIEAASP